MQSIPEQSRAMAQVQGDQPLILTSAGSVSFVELDRDSDQVAGWLAAQGVRRGDRIALYCGNSDAFVAAYLGIVKAGAVVVPVNLLLNPAEVAFILQDAGARGLFYHVAFADSVKSFRRALPGLEFAVAIGDGAGAAGDAALADLLSSALAPPVPDLDPKQDLAAILYTSGTTGRPKGAMLTHDNLLSNTRSVVSALRLEPGRDRLLVVLPMFHAFAATVGMLTPLLHGLALVPVPKFEPGLVSELIGATGATVFLGVPSMYNVLLRHAEQRRVLWRTVRFGVSGGAAMPVELMKRFEQVYGFPILEGDGPTECSPVTCVNPLDGRRKPGSVGLAVPEVEIEIFDDQGARVATGEIGEICVRGPSVMKGYWKLPEVTSETMFGEWLRTGDLGYKDADGYVFIVDRKKDMIIVNGMNVYPRVIEEWLYGHPHLAEAAVVGEPDQRHGEVPVAYVVPVEGETLTAAEVKAFCREGLGRHEIPRRVVFRDQLPKNAAGKILKRELRRDGELERGIDGA
jgi:long-chain acyl-CoA synthetase